jgi:predicted lipid-binding transport protein (Tim44 family)
MGGNVPLSEHEQRQLEQIEQSLYADYPRFAHAVRASDPRVHYKRRVVEAAFGFLLGIGMLLGGVVANIILIGVAGFVVMLACAMWALSSWRHMTGNAAARSTAAGTADAPGSATGEGTAGRRGGGGRRSSAGRSGAGRGSAGRSGAKDRRSGRAHSPGFMERLEERWRRRQERDR